MEITGDSTICKIFLTQKRYLEKIQDKLNMLDAKSSNIRIASHIKLSSKDNNKTNQEFRDMNTVHNARGVGSLRYAMVCTRPDFAYEERQEIHVL